MPGLSQIFGGTETDAIGSTTPRDSEADQSTAAATDGSGDASRSESSIDRMPEDEQYDVLNPQFGATVDDSGIA